jgi:ubiquinone/menaquinone biosynthesis C-methylase UbiE
MDAKLQRRIQRYGWDLAARDYEALWLNPLAPAQTRLLQCAALRPGEHVLDVASGTGLVAFTAAEHVGPSGRVLGVDLSGEMVAQARSHADAAVHANVAFERMDAEVLALADASFDVVLCALGLMYVPEPEQALREMRRVLKPGGRAVLAVWGPRDRCGWADAFSIVDAEVQGDVCPLFFRLGLSQALARLCTDAGFTAVEEHRIATTLQYTDGATACDAVFVGGPVALAWARFDAAARKRVRAAYLRSVAPWRTPTGYAIPAEFVVVAAHAPALAAADQIHERQVRLRAPSDLTRQA